jgi:hypothetical protein
VRNGGDDPVTGNPGREHWIVPVHGQASGGPEGIRHAIAHRDGTVVLHLTRKDPQARMRLAPAHK